MTLKKIAYIIWMICVVAILTASIAQANNCDQFASLAHHAITQKHQGNPLDYGDQPTIKNEMIKNSRHWPTFHDPARNQQAAHLFVMDWRYACEQGWYVK